MELPTGVRTAVLKLLVAVETGESIQAVNMASQRAEGFVLGLETAHALKPDMIEFLYTNFDAAAAQQRTAICDAMKALN